MTLNTAILRVATESDLPIIHRLAHEIWWPTYETYLAHCQINLMLEMIYSEQALQAQLEAGQRFSLAMRGNTAVGFVGFQTNQAKPQVMRIEKLYVRQSEQGKGTGKLLINHVAKIALTAGCVHMELNVNRCNPATRFYSRMGFVIIATVDIPYYGYILNDYVMQKELREER